MAVEAGAQVRLSINGQEIVVPAGATVLEAAQAAGIDIPTLCYDPELSRPGACRLCVVEIEGFRNLPAACVTQVAEGMKVDTESEAVVEARKVNLELLLANHPLDCLTCEKAGECKLQEYAYRYGVRGSTFTGERIHYDPIEDNPFIVRDNNKCILCGKCIRVCEEVQGRAVLGFAYRGFATQVLPAMELPMEEAGCVFCGSCVSVCPVGALTERDMRGQGRRWEVNKVRTVCTYCGTGCSFDLNVKDGRVIGITSAADAEVNGRALCAKGRFGYRFIHHPDRLTQPLVRKNGELVPVSWEEALQCAAQGLARVRDSYGSDALAVLSSARCTNEENYLVQKFTRAVLGTNNVDHCARL